MIAERLPELATMSREDKWAVYHELGEELHETEEADETPEFKAAVIELLEARMQHYREHPETARPWEEVRARLRERFETWKSDRLKSA